MTKWAELKPVRGNHVVNQWTPEREEIVRVMWQDGHSAAQIAKTLACGLSRMAVIGKVHRKGWGQRERAASPLANIRFRPGDVRRRPDMTNAARDARRAAERAGRPVSETVVAKTKPRRPTPICEPVNLEALDLIPLEKLTGHTCRWPIGDPQDPAFGFCGAHAPIDRPYCGEHHRKAYTHVPKPARARSHAETDRKLREARRWAA